jgi:chromosome partitioning protein
MILALLNQKGGVGKTTLALHIATTLRLRGDTVLLVDADPQGSALDWAATRLTPPIVPVIGMATHTLHRTLPTHAAQYTHVVIDGPPRASEIARAAVLAADVVLIPIQPSPYDVWAAQAMVDVIQEARVFKEVQTGAFVVNRTVAHTALARAVREALASYPLPVLRTAITQRVAYAECAAVGSTVVEQQPAGPASKEIHRLVDDLLAFAPRERTI